MKSHLLEQVYSSDFDSCRVLRAHKFCHLGWILMFLQAWPFDLATHILRTSGGLPITHKFLHHSALC